MNKEKDDYLIIRSGISGKTIAYELRKRDIGTTIAIINKKENVTKHASGRNFEVLHTAIRLPKEYKKIIKKLYKEKIK